jgi:hypothetical protein
MNAVRLPIVDRPRRLHFLVPDTLVEHFDLHLLDFRQALPLQGSNDAPSPRATL